MPAPACLPIGGRVSQKAARDRQMVRGVDTAATQAVAAILQPHTDSHLTPPFPLPRQHPLPVKAIKHNARQLLPYLLTSCGLHHIEGFRDA